MTEQQTAAAPSKWKPWHKKTLIGVGGAFAFFMLVGMCAGDPDPKPETPAAVETVTETATPEAAPAATETVETAAPEAAPEPPTVDELFVEKARELGISGGDITIVALGHGICALFEEGRGVTDTGLSLISEGNITMSQAGSLMGMSAAAYCPNFGHLFDQ